MINFQRKDNNSYQATNSVFTTFNGRRELLYQRSVESKEIITYNHHQEMMMDPPRRHLLH